MKRSLYSTEEIGLKPDVSGKVRDIFDLGDKLLIVATDRISAYDSILPDPIPGKGVILTQMTLGWYEHFANEINTHFLTSELDDFPVPFKNQVSLDGRSMLVSKAERLDVECVVRGYLAGSGWKEYTSSGKICGIKLPEGLQESSELPNPVFTPATKAESGHDINISFDKMASIVPGGIAEQLKNLSLGVYNRARDYAAAAGIILADTKFEFGILGGEIILIDELLSPDSSRFWPSEDYEPGRPQASYDKQFVRDYLDHIGWDRNPPAPALPPDVIGKTIERYEEASKMLFPTIEYKEN